MRRRNCVEYALFSGESVAEVNPKWCSGCQTGYDRIADTLRNSVEYWRKKWAARYLKDDFTCTYRPPAGTPWDTGYREFQCPVCSRTVKAMQTKRSEV